MKKSNRVPLYFDGQHYDLHHQHLIQDIAFYSRMAREYGSPVLELACGTGRISLALAEEGFEITGIDRSDTMLKWAEKKSTGKNLPVTWIRADMRGFDLGRKFNLIFLPFNTLAHLHDFESINSLFASVKKHLAPQGRFILDFFNPDFNYLLREENRWFPVTEYSHPDFPEPIKIEEKNRYDKARQINHIIWKYQMGEQGFTTRLDMRIYFPQELDACFRYNGLVIEDKYGDFDESAFNSDSPLQIIISRLP
ncbi:MAG: class I SAM-dependent methyltransferase [Calditrichia bacterium]